MRCRYEKKIIYDRYYQIVFKWGSDELIAYAFTLGNELATIENFSAFWSNREYQERLLQFSKDHAPNLVRIKSLDLDFEIKTEDFLKTKHLWEDTNGGIFIVFHKKPLNFKASKLKGAAYYEALDAFGWNLDLVTPNSSEEYLWCVSPQEEIILKIEEKAKSLGFTEGDPFKYY